MPHEDASQVKALVGCRMIILHRDKRWVGTHLLLKLSRSANPPPERRSPNALPRDGSAGGSGARFMPQLSLVSAREGPASTSSLEFRKVTP